jgi:hypothetical protein
MQVELAQVPRWERRRKRRMAGGWRRIRGGGGERRHLRPWSRRRRGEWRGSRERRYKGRRERRRRVWEGRRGVRGTEWGEKGARVEVVYILYEHDQSHWTVDGQLEIIGLFGPKLALLE